MKHNLKLFDKNINNKSKLLPLLTRRNTIGKTKYIPPFFKEWKNLGYFYNKNTIKKLPIMNIFINKLIKVYFNLFYKNLKKNKVSVKRRKNFLNNIYISKAEIKYTNSISIITIHTMNNFNKIFSKYEEYLNYLVRKKEWIERWKYIFVSGNVYWDRKKHSFQKARNKWIKKKFLVKQSPISIMKQYIRPNFLNIIQFKPYYKKNNLKLFYSYSSPNLQFNNFNDIIKYNFDFYNRKLKLYYLEMIKLRLYEIKDEYSLYLETLWKYNQINSTNFTKLNYNSFFILKLKNILSRILNTKIELNIINIKYHSYNSDFFTKSLSLKLKKKKFNIMKSMTNIINRSKLNLNKLVNNNNIHLIKNEHKDLSLISVINNKNLTNLLNERYSTDSSITKNLTLNNDNKIYNIIFNNIKYKYIAGIRLEIKGRLTKRYRADRSIYKLLWKGGLRNKDISLKKLSSVMFRGDLESKIMYSISKDKRRIGAFAVKGWISGK